VLDLKAITPTDVAGVCDHTFLHRPECFRKAADPLVAYHEAFGTFVEAALKLAPAPYAMCIRAEELSRLRRRLAEAGREDIKLAAVVGFPVGDAFPPDVKAAEVSWAIDEGADEIDTVLRWDDLRRGELRRVAEDLAIVASAARGAVFKVIFEICYLDDAQIVQACRLCEDVGAEFVKTSTGFAAGGATVRALKLMRANFSGGVKISGGVNSGNLAELLGAALDPDATKLDPARVRIGESSLL
jgi:deoxyribose-phosphate aldolase